MKASVVNYFAVILIRPNTFFAMDDLSRQNY
ncbi:hypothetical protein EMGBS15_07000 [Filimonas sp.]|nr:hypothetical protein EMGBS15_07000 [Filimonas sp.]